MSDIHQSQVILPDLRNCWNYGINRQI